MDVSTLALDQRSSPTRSAATTSAQAARFGHMNTTAAEAERQHESHQTAATEVPINRRIINSLQKSTKQLSSSYALDGIVTGVPGGSVLGRLGLVAGIATLVGSCVLVCRILKANTRN